MVILMTYTMSNRSQPASRSNSNTTSRTMSNRPRTIDELAKAARYKFAVLPDLKVLIRGVQDLLQQARIYEEEQDIETAYVLFSRCYKVTVEEIPKHPDFDPTDQAVSDRLVLVSVQALRDLTRLRPLIEAKYVTWVNLGVRASKQASVPHHIHISTCASSSRPPIAPVASTSELPSTSHNPTPTFSTANISQTPYIPIVQATKPPRPTFVRATTSPPSLEQQARNASAPIAILSPAPIPQYVRTNAPTVRLLPSPGSPPSKGQYASPLSMPPEASRSAGSNQPMPGPTFDSKMHRLPPPPPVVAGYQHNSRKPAALIPITSPRHLHMHSQSQEHTPSPSHSHHHSYPHSLTRSLSPVRVLHAAPTSTRHQAVQIPIRSSESPPISRSTSLQHASSNSLAGRRLPSPSPPPVQRWTKPGAISSKVTSSSPSPPKIASESDGNGIPPGRLRMLILPSDLIDMFAAIALPNTEKNIETCAFIMGELKDNVLYARLLVIPKQTGCSDTCTTTNEEEIWTVTDREDVIFLGWIHTHPKHDCFLSSKDLHTQAGYQQLLPECIAIVVAPTRHPSVGIFHLTDAGLRIISECQRGLDFHYHDEAVPLYTEAWPGEGHIMIRPRSQKTRVIDLR